MDARSQSHTAMGGTRAGQWWDTPAWAVTHTHQPHAPLRSPSYHAGACPPTRRAGQKLASPALWSCEWETAFMGTSSLHTVGAEWEWSYASTTTTAAATASAGWLVHVV